MTPAPGSPLTAREIEIVGLVALGMSNADIGRRLFLSPLTVKTHMWRISKKLGIGDRGGIVGAAYHTGILKVSGSAVGEDRYAAGHRDGWAACATMLAAAGLDVALRAVAPVPGTAEPPTAVTASSTTR